MADVDFERGGRTPSGDSMGIGSALKKTAGRSIAAFFAFVLVMALAEQLGLSHGAIGILFLLGTVSIYAVLGIKSRSTDEVDFYAAGRRVPAVYNGMAVGAEWISAAGFIGLTGSLYLAGFGSLAFIMGWTGGYCLIALLLAPYLRKFGQYTVPDFLGSRYGQTARFIAAMAAILCSFTYLMAQIYGVGLITTRLSGLTFEVGIFVGLGGILLCSLLGGMQAVTWTQVAQYVILIVAYLVPLTWLSIRQTGIPLPQIVYGVQLEMVTTKEKQLVDDPKEREVVAIFKARSEQLAVMLRDVPAALVSERAAAQKKVDELKAATAPLAEVQAAERALATVPRDEDAARAAWTRAKVAADARTRPLGGMPPHAQAFSGDPGGDSAQRKTFDDSRRNFLAMVFCLMLGTASLPHILMRYYCTPSVKEARESVTWSLFFILALYLSAPALAVLVKHEVFNVLVGTPFDELPAWIAGWSRIDPALISVSDVNMDGVLQLGEIRFGGDIIVLATPEIGGMPYVISGLVAAGGLAAALSTADGLLLAMSNALGHDVYYKMIDTNAPSARRLVISKALLVVVAVLAALVAAQKPADMLFLVSAAFSSAAATFFPAMVLGIFWKRATAAGAALGMAAGLGITFYYMSTTQPWLRSVFGVTSPIADNLWWSIQPISAGLFGVPLGFAVIIAVSLLTPAPKAEVQDLVEHVRYPNVKARH